jgi:hypothetical protein
MVLEHFSNLYYALRYSPSSLHGFCLKSESPFYKIECKLYIAAPNYWRITGITVIASYTSRITDSTLLVLTCISNSDGAPYLQLLSRITLTSAPN